MNTPRPPETVLDLLRKVKALADAGAAGERDAARAQLDKLLRKHGITEAELSETEKRLQGFKFSNLQEELLLFVIVARVANANRSPTCYVGDGKKNKLWFKLTTAEAIDVETQFAFYKAHWKEEQHLFFRAFIFAQGLGIESDTPKRITTDEELHEARRIQGMQTFVRARTPHRQLEVSRK